MGLPPVKTACSFISILLACGVCLVFSCVGFACQPSKIILDCRGKQLTTFPSHECGFNKTDVHCLILSKNRIRRVTSSMFSSLKDLEKLSLDDNGLTSIQPKAFNKLVSLRVLNLFDNKMKQLSSSMFSGLTNLTELRLDNNEVTSIERGALNHLKSLRVLSLSGNRIKHLKTSMFSGLSNLEKLIIEENGLMSVYPGALDDLVSLRVLNVRKNKLDKIPHFNVSSKVTTLYLAFNPIASLQLSTMKNYPQLVFLFLIESRITRLKSRIFSYNTKLRRLNLFNSPLEHIDDNAFDGVQLTDLNLGGTKITNLPGKGMESLKILNIRKVKSLWELPFRSFKKLWDAKVEYHFHCCLFQKYYANAEATNPNFKNHSVVKLCPTSIPSSTTVKQKPKTDEKQSSDDIFGNHKDWYEDKNLTKTFPPTLCINVGDSKFHVQDDENKKFICEPLPDAFNPCEDLLGSMGLRICTWIVLILALLGNGLQLLVLFTSKRNTTMYRVLMCNLSLANLFMGIYLFMLAVTDARTFNEYQNHAKAWQFGPGCNIAGFISILSTELAVYTLTVITVERYFTIVHPMKLDMHLSTRQIIILMIFGWAFALIMAVLPIFNVSSYQRVAICLPFDVETPVSKMYVTALLTTNGLAFFTVLICYTRMYFSIGGTSCSSASSTTRMESRVAKKMAFLVFSNFACWFPIALFSLIAVYGSPIIDVPTSKFLLVFVYPINAFTNPYLYALGTKHFQLDLLDLLKQLGLCPKGSEKLRNKLLDQIASLPNTSKAYMGSRSSINSYRIPSRHSVDSSPNTLHSRRSTSARKVSTFSCRFLPIPKMSFSYYGDPTDSTDRSRASSESTSEFSTTQMQPLMKLKRHKNGHAGDEALVSPIHARRSSAREVIIGGKFLDKNKNGCQPEDGKKSLFLDNEEIYDNESCIQDENQDAKTDNVPVVMVTSC